MNKSFLTLLKENWVVMAFIVQLVMTWGFLNSSVIDHEERIDRLETSKEQNALIVAEINSRLSSIETSLKFIEKQLK
jgi:hypothetical protein